MVINIYTVGVKPILPLTKTSTDLELTSSIIKCQRVDCEMKHAYNKTGRKLETEIKASCLQIRGKKQILSQKMKTERTT
jgi:hypothetical protein